MGRSYTRREVLIALGLAGPGAAFVAGCTVSPPSRFPPPVHDQPGSGPFPDGVGSGDPRPGGSSIWTRVAAEGAEPVPVLWMVSQDEAGSSIVASGTAAAVAANAFCLSIAVDDLPNDAWLYYRFETLGDAPTSSETGRLRTAPATGSTPDHLRFAFTSCQQLNDSWFSAHTAIANEPGLDFCVHLGDYIYVNDTSTLSLDDYRALYRRWRRDPRLRELHARLPMVAMWDDGEFVNGVDRTIEPTRGANARKAWLEAFALPGVVGDRIYRGLTWGSLADLPVLDVRQYRDPAIDAIDLTGPPGNEAYDPTRTTLGAEQNSWLRSRLAGSAANWRLVQQGYNIAPWRLVNEEFLRPFRPDLPPNAGIYAPNEAWDDYQAERRDLLSHLHDTAVTDTVFCSAHTHVFMASALRPDPDNLGSPIVAHDFVSGSLTADPDPRRSILGSLPFDTAESVLGLAERWIVSQNPGMRHVNLIDQGYVIVDVTPDRVEIDFRLVDTYDPGAQPWTGAKFRLPRGGVLETLPAERARGAFA